MDYLDRTLMAISEAWETILLEMDEKLSRYAEANPPGAVAADFLELLMIGIPSVNLENFLLRDLTEKGLKKLGHSIEMCYSNIQVLIPSLLAHLDRQSTIIAYNLQFKLAETRPQTSQQRWYGTDLPACRNDRNGEARWTLRSSRIYLGNFNSRGSQSGGGFSRQGFGDSTGHRSQHEGLQGFL